MRTALVTGANKGIGFAVAKGLAADGFEVWIGSRDLDRGETALEALRGAGLTARLLQIDVTSPESVAEAFKSMAGVVPHLDVLVNNAGIVRDRTALPSIAAIDEIKAVYEVNVFGPIRVTQSFLPLLKESADARVVFMSSGLASLSLATDPDSIYSTVNLLGYSSSKTALNAVSVAFAKELAPFGIAVNSVEPGNVATDLNGHEGMLSPDEGAMSTLRLLRSRPNGVTGQFLGLDGPQPW
jgi:NAD(P)-dependent dehydrogenase (short-subunit alcohol dehydrogenase family)